MVRELHVYKIKENRFKRSFLSGFNIAENDSLVTDEEGFRHVFICNAIDGGAADAEWGRLKFNLKLGEEMVLTVYAAALDERYIEERLFDEKTDIAEKKRIMENVDAEKKVNSSDMLLFNLRGRYLYLVFDIIGRGKAQIDGIKVSTSDDMIMDTMPELYSDNDFFRRYLAVFSSMSIDFQEKIMHIDDLFDVDKAPRAFLPHLAGWMGIDVSGDFLEEDRLRLLVKEAYYLNKMKGTKAAFERLTEIVLGEKAIVLEKNVFREYSQISDKNTYDALYGELPYDVTMLIKTYVPENQKSQLVFLLNQFKPVRCRLMIRFLDGSGEVDRHSYLDMNACVQEYTSASLDSRQSSDDMILLDE